MAKKLTEHEIDKIVDGLYASYASSTGILFGIPAGCRDGVTSVIKAFLRQEGRW